MNDGRSVRTLFGFPMLNGSLDDAMARVRDFSGNCPGDREPLVFTPNLDILVRLKQLEQRVPAFVARLHRAVLVLPDGFPVVFASRFLGRPLQGRLTGADLMERLVQSVTGQNFLVITPDEKTAIQLQERMKSETDNNLECLVAPFMEIGSPEFDDFAGRIVDRVKQTRPDYVILSLGFPKQEMLAFAVLDTLKNEGRDRLPLFFGLGASAQFYAGTKRRAPGWMQRLHLEWFHRMLHEPRRMTPRYLWDALLFVPLLVREWRRQRKEPFD